MSDETPQVPPTDVIRVESGKASRILDRERIGDCDCGGTRYRVERTTGYECIGMWPEIAPEAEARWEQTERSIECDHCGVLYYL